MWYFIRVLAALPGLTVGLCSIALWVAAFMTDIYWLVIPCILLFWGAMMCNSAYENTVDNLYDLWLILCGKVEEE